MGAGPLVLDVATQILAIIFFSPIGLVVRLLIAELFKRTDDISIYLPTPMTNLISGFIVGFLYKVKLVHPEWMNPYLLTGIKIGFCGSLSSFSLWIYAIVSISLDLKIYLTLVVSLIERHAANYLAFYSGYSYIITQPPEDRPRKVDVDVWFTFYFYLIVNILLYTGFILFVTFSAPNYSVALLWAPLGSTTRYLLTRFLDIPHFFFFGSYLANVISCILTSAIRQNPSLFPNQGKYFVSGFCWTLSTFSSYVSVTADMPFAAAVLYYGVTYVSCVAITLMIILFYK